MKPDDRDEAMQRDQPPRQPSDITADKPQPLPAALRLDVRAKKGRLWWTLAVLALLALADLVGVSVWRMASSVTADDDPSIVVVGNSGEDKFMEGLVYDKAVLNVDASQIVVLPDTATVEHGAPEGHVEIYMRKHTIEGGFPRPTSDSHIRDMRTYMGCVRRTEEGRLLVATYGEWSGMEQGAAELLLIRVSDHQAIEVKAGLSGDEPVKGFARAHRSPREAGEDGWEAIPAQPDPARTASRAKQ